MKTIFSLQIFIVAIILNSTLSLNAQTNFNKAFLEFQDMNGVQLKHALVGGLNAPQFSNVDFNNDGVQDLFVFDRIGDVPLAFLSNNTPGEVDFQFAPQYVRNFPELHGWVLLRDYDCDGIEDIFTYSQTPGVAGISVFKGYYDSQNRIAFNLVPFPDYFYDVLSFPGFNNFPTNLYVSDIDIPTVDDIDGDSDMDVLTFSIGGGYMELYENQSADLGYGCDSLIFELVDDCWGRFYESGIDEVVNLSPSIDSCVGRSTFIGMRHAGSASMTIDMDNDGDKEIMLGDISFTNITLLSNAGQNTKAWMDNQEIFFPADDTPVEIVIFPAPFNVDINNDNIKDFLTAPNASNVSENYFSSWYYENVASNEFPDFEYRKNDFLIEDMIDKGSGAHPVFVDYNGDGLEDIAIGTLGYFESGGNYLPSIFIYENIGSATQPIFRLVETDFAATSGLGLMELHPAFGDLDGDDDLDMLLGSNLGSLYYFENTAGAGNLMSFATPIPDYAGIDVSQNSTPQLVDLDRNGTLDLLIGERSFGNINYYKNTGTPQAATFTIETEFLGFVDTREPDFPVGYSVPLMVDINNSYHFFSAGGKGNIRHYANIEDSIDGTFIVTDSMIIDYIEGQRTAIDMKDINADGKLDLIVGNQRGGIALYSEGILLSDINPITDLKNSLQLFPNPASDLVQISYLETPLGNSRLRVFNALGQLMHQEEFTEQSQIDVSNFASGVYFFNVQLDKQQATLKFVKE